MNNFFSSFVEGRKGEILDAALEVFSEKGYTGGSMRDIAQRTGVSEPALYRHFSGKEDLFINLITKAGEKLLQEAYQLLENIDYSRIRESLEFILHDRSLAAKSYFPVMKTIMFECLRHSAFLELYKKTLVEPAFKKINTVISSIDEYYGHYRSPLETRKKIRLIASLFAGYFVTSAIFKENQQSIIIDEIINTMGWYDEGHRYREDLMLAELPTDFHIIKVDELKELINKADFPKKTTMLDLRGKEAFTKDHIPGSVQVSIKELPELYKKMLPDKNKDVIVICNGGMQSLYAVMYLQIKGYKKVKSLSGGFSKWNKE